LVIDKGKILDIAQKYVLKGQSEKAIKEYQKRVKASPKDIRSHLKLGDQYLKNGENEKAIGEYLKVAELYMAEDLTSRAISIYKKVLSIDAKRIEALHQIAQLYEKEGLRGDARNYYQTILRIRPDDREALDALRNIEEHKEPRQVPKKAASADPLPQKHPHPPEKMAGIGSSTPSSSTALPSSGPAIEPQVSSVDKDAEMHYHLGIAYKEMELYDYAVSEFEMASANSSIKIDCCIMLGDCFMEKGEMDKSIQYYKTASELKGLSNVKLARLHFNLGRAYEANGMTSEALESFNRVLQFDPSLSEAQDKIKKLKEIEG
jgi:tetratricopeptide (TPR) repeat protein